MPGRHRMVLLNYVDLQRSGVHAGEHDKSGDGKSTIFVSGSIQPSKAPWPEGKWTGAT